MAASPSPTAHQVALSPFHCVIGHTCPEHSLWAGEGLSSGDMKGTKGRSFGEAPVRGTGWGSGDWKQEARSLDLASHGILKEKPRRNLSWEATQHSTKGVDSGVSGPRLKSRPLLTARSGAGHCLPSEPQFPRTAVTVMPTHRVVGSILHGTWHTVSAQ